MLADWRLAAPAAETPLVGLLSAWAARGRQDSPEPQVQPLHPSWDAQTLITLENINKLNNLT